MMRPRAYEHEVYPWNHRRIPETVIINGESTPHPARRSAVFVVHGMGKPEWFETAAGMRSGFEDAVDAIRTWQKKHPVPGGDLTPDLDPLPTPFIWDGFWADYTDIRETFSEDWALFAPREQQFYAGLWRRRTISVPRTYAWFLKQQLRLLGPRVLAEVGVGIWALYLPLQLVSLGTLTSAALFHQRVISDFLADVRLYLDPRGLVEKAIVQRIDRRVGAEFLRLIGLDWDFRALPEHQRIDVSGRRIEFERVVWVAHSLGSVISYNVLSDLFHRAAELASSDDDAQQQGVAKFRAALKRFVTMGSPLDKVAFLYGDVALRPWPDVDRETLLAGGDTPPDEDGREWWTNFYHVLDPVSGALSSRTICGKHPPLNLHIGIWKRPGWAHVAYWRDVRSVRYIFARTYGRESLRDRDYARRPTWLLAVLAGMAYAVWALVILIPVGLVLSVAAVLVAGLIALVSLLF